MLTSVILGVSRQFGAGVPPSAASGPGDPEHARFFWVHREDGIDIARTASARDDLFDMSMPVLLSTSARGPPFSTRHSIVPKGHGAS